LRVRHQPAHALSRSPPRASLSTSAASFASSAYPSTPRAGGIAPKLIARILEGDLYNAYTNQPASRFSTVISKFPLHVVLNDKVGLLGTCEYAVAMARRAAH